MTAAKDSPPVTPVSKGASNPRRHIQQPVHRNGSGSRNWLFSRRPLLLQQQEVVVSKGITIRTVKMHNSAVQRLIKARCNIKQSMGKTRRDNLNLISSMDLISCTMSRSSKRLRSHHMRLCNHTSSRGSQPQSRYYRLNSAFHNNIMLQVKVDQLAHQLRP